MIPSRKAQEVGGADTLEEHRWRTRTPDRPSRLVTLLLSHHQLLEGSILGRRRLDSVSENRNIHPCIHSLGHLFTFSLAHSASMHSLMHSFIQSFIHLYTLIHTLIHTHPHTYSSTHPFSRLFVPPSTHLFTHSFIHAFIHSHTHPPGLTRDLTVSTVLDARAAAQNNLSARMLTCHRVHAGPQHLQGVVWW